jgi:hypothetical protein
MESCLPSVCAWLHKVYIANSEEKDELKLQRLQSFWVLLCLLAFNFAKIISDACLQK